MKRYLFFKALFSGCMKFLKYILLTATLFTPAIVRAENVLDVYLKQAGGAAYGVAGDPPEPAVVIGNIIQQALILVGIIMFAVVIYAGILWLTGGGSEERITKAKNLLQNAFWGMVITAGGYVIAFFVTEKIFKAAVGG